MIEGIDCIEPEDVVLGNISGFLLIGGKDFNSKEFIEKIAINHLKIEEWSVDNISYLKIFTLPIPSYDMESPIIEIIEIIKPNLEFFKYEIIEKNLICKFNVYVEINPFATPGFGLSSEMVQILSDLYSEVDVTIQINTNDNPKIPIQNIKVLSGLTTAKAELILYGTHFDLKGFTEKIGISPTEVEKIGDKNKWRVFTESVWHKSTDLHPVKDMATPIHEVLKIFKDKLDIIAEEIQNQDLQCKILAVLYLAVLYIEKNNTPHFHLSKETIHQLAEINAWIDYDIYNYA